MTTVLPQPHSARAHATLAPSASHRWINCPGSVKASEGVEEKSSRFAAEGTAAHQLANFVLETGIDAGDHLGHFIDIDAEGHGIRQSAEANGITIFKIDEEMVEGVNLYADYVREIMEKCDGVAILDVEQRLDMTHIHPAIFGTGDAVVYDIANEHLHVCDFKYGKGILVSPEQNPQLFLYGAGAARRYHAHRLNKITLHVIQPRTQGEAIKSWDTDVLELIEFEDEIGRAARETDKPDAAIVPGDWCQDGFCPIRATCPTRRTSIFAAAQAEFGDVTGEMTLPAVADLSPEQRGIILRQADQIFSFVKAVQEFEHGNALAGNPPDGFKLVAKRATRKWKSEETAEALLSATLGDADLFVPPAEPKFRSPPQLETHMGKKAFAALIADIEAETEEKLVVKKSSGVNLVPNEDPAPAIGVGALAEFTAVDL